jgi:mannose-6-phosphate isomerase-like protein (cupin superfamily)
MRLATIFLTALALASVAAALSAPMAGVAQSSPPGPGSPPSALVLQDIPNAIQALVPAAQASGSSGKTLADYGSYKLQLSVRTSSGGAEVHAHWDDVMTVETGSATLITGGTVIDGKTGADGETHGVKIDGGSSREIHPGDVLTIRAGTPHQLILKPGMVYGAVVVKIHEP